MRWTRAVVRPMLLVVPPVLVSITSVSAYSSAAGRDGRLDKTFGNNGRVVTRIRGSAMWVSIAADRKIVALVRPDAYSSFEGARHILRLRSDGTFDPTYGTEGMSTELPIFGEQAALRRDGSVVVAGYALIGSEGTRVTDSSGRVFTQDTHRLAVTRVRSDGSRDTSFGDHGTTVLQIGTSTRVVAMTTTHDGAITVVVASAFASTDKLPTHDVSIVRLRRTGGLDTRFAHHGVATIKIATQSPVQGVVAPPFLAAGIDSSGRTVVVGDLFGRLSEVSAIRVRSDGTLDRRFGVNGRISNPFGVLAQRVGDRPNLPVRGSVQRDGITIAAGSENGPLGVQRLDATGRVDQRFGDRGVAQTSLKASPRALAVLANGKILVAGTRCCGKFTVVRFRSNGKLDSAFASNGVVVTDVVRGGIEDDEAVTAIAVQPDGKILVAGWAYSGGDNNVALVRYTGSSGPVPSN